MDFDFIVQLIDFFKENIYPVLSKKICSGMDDMIIFFHKKQAEKKEHELNAVNSQIDKYDFLISNLKKAHTDNNEQLLLIESDLKSLEKKKNEISKEIEKINQSLINFARFMKIGGK